MADIDFGPGAQRVPAGAENEVADRVAVEHAPAHGIYSVSFIFAERDLDDAFFALDAQIEQAAEQTVGFLGKESWASPDGARRNSVYYWRDLDALKAFSRHPLHLEAKSRYQEWYAGFHVVVAKVLKSYGDGALGHITPNARNFAVAKSRPEQ